MNIHNLCRVKNITGSPILIRGQILAAGVYYEITDIERQWWAFDDDLYTHITVNDPADGNIVVNDGVQDFTVANGFSVADQLELLRLNYTADAVRIQNTRVDAAAKDHDYVLSFKKDNPGGAFDPYEDRVVYKKIADLGGSGRAIELSILHNESTPYVTNSSAVYKTQAYTVFPGTGGAGSPAAVRAIFWSVAAGNYSSFRLYDQTNLVVLAELVDNTDGNDTIKTIPILNPFPINQAVLVCQMKKGPNNPESKPALAAVEIFF